jgi:hypothetical protein
MKNHRIDNDHGGKNRNKTSQPLNIIPGAAAGYYLRKLRGKKLHGQS